MPDQPLLPNPSQNGVSRGNALAHLPVRPSYVELPQPTVLDDTGSSLLEYWNMFRRRKGALLLIAFLGLLAGLLLTLPQTPVYQARTTIEIQNVNQDFLHMRDVSPTANGEGSNPVETDLQTEVSILQSNSVLIPVIANLHLSTRLVAQKDSDRVSAWRQLLGLPKPPAASVDVLPLVVRNLKVNAQPNTRLVEILYDSTDPRLAADVANALTAEFIKQNLESRWKATQQTGEWLTRQMEDVRIKLEKSEEQLQAYARTAGLLFTEEKDNVAEARLRELQEEFSKAQADRVIHQSRYELVTTASPDSLPEVLDDPTLQDYQVKLTDLRRQLAELSSTLTLDHPSVKKVQAEVSTLETALEKERVDVTRRIQNEFESAQRRERMLAASYDAQAQVVTEQADKVSHYEILKREVDNNRRLYDSMLQHVNEAAVASALQASNVRVVDPARVPARPYKPSLMLNAMLGLFSGIFLGIAFVVMRARADRSIQAPGEAALYLGAPELGVIPSAGAERSRGFSSYYRPKNAAAGELEQVYPSGPVELVVSQRRPSVMGESFRSTVDSILFARENGSRPHVIAITSASPQEGKTTVAANLAQGLAEIGQRVLLIDGDLRRPRMHDLFKVPNEWGLSDLLAGTQPLEEFTGMFFETSCPFLYVLPAGSVPTNISNLLHSRRALEFLERMRKEYDIVIIDTPPMLQIPDARVLGRMADAVILVVRSGRTTKEVAAAAGQRLAEDGTRVLGTVLNDWDPRKTNDTGYEYGYRSHYYNSSQQGR